MAADRRASEPFAAARFRVSWDGRAIPGVVAVGRLGWSLGEGRDGSLIAQTDTVRLERERTADDAFEIWAERARRAAPGGRQKLREGAAKDVSVELIGTGGAERLVLMLRACVPLAYVPVDGLDAAGGDAAREVLVLEAESVERASDADGAARDSAGAQ